MKAVGEMLSQIFTNFHPEVFMQFVSGYKGVFALMVIGYVLHFMPKRSEDVLMGNRDSFPFIDTGRYIGDSDFHCCSV